MASFLLLTDVLGQNLIPNPSFEEHWNCPVTTSNFSSDIKIWYDPVPADPEYYNSCSSSPYAGVPLNVAGSQQSFDGNAYCGFFWASSFGNGPTSKEYIAVPLTQTLEQGKKYCVSYYVSLADSCQLAMDRLGAHFLTDALTGNFSEYSPPIIPSIETPLGEFYDNKTDWREVSGTYCAEGGERFLVIGNFNKNTQTNFMPMTTWSNDFWGSVYYYVDLVKLFPCGSCIDSNDKLPNILTPNGDGVNDELLFEDNQNHLSISIYNRWGVSVFTKTGHSIKWDGKNLNGKLLNNGTYFYLLQSHTKTQTGTIHLFY